MESSPSSTTTETPGEKTLRRYYETKLANRLIQMGQMAEDRALLRRGARKMQDGTLYQGGGSEEDDAMNIRIGDDVHHHHPAKSKRTETALAPIESSLTSGWLKKAAVAAALVGGGVGVGAVPYLLSDPQPTEPVVETAVPITIPPNMEYLLRFSD